MVRAVRLLLLMLLLSQTLNLSLQALDHLLALPRLSLELIDFLVPRLQFQEK